MIKFKKNIVQFGFGAIGKSFYEKISKEIDFNENKYFVITRDKSEFDAYINLGGIAKNFLVLDINKENFSVIFKNYLSDGDLLIDFADTVGTKDILNWCIKQNVMYINTGEADWPDNWYNILNENKIKTDIKNTAKNKYPIILQHGNNPGLVSHFVKAGIEYIITNQHSKNKIFKQLLKCNNWAKLAQLLELNMIHVNDIDLQKTNTSYPQDTLINTWCIDSFFFEMLSNSTLNIGTHESIDDNIKYNLIDMNHRFLELKQLAIHTKINTYYPEGKFESFLVPHEETITIANNLELKENGKTIYKPTVMFLYSPCESAKNYFKNAQVNSYPDVDFSKPLDSNNPNNQSIIRGYLYPQKSEILYKEKIDSGTEYVGILLIGKNFKPVWIGNRIKPSFLYKSQKTSYWQTPTITPVAMSTLSAVCWMIKNQDKGGVYFPDDIPDYKSILKTAEKYISKTIFKTFNPNDLENSLNIDLSNIKFQDFFTK